MTSSPTNSPVMAEAGASRDIIVNAQALRFVAALLVVIVHAQLAVANQNTSFTPWLPIDWAIGVDIFFVISGFIMFVVAHEQFGAARAPRLFFIRRLKRIVPLYYIFTTLAVALQFVGGTESRERATDLPHIIASYLFLPWTRLGSDTKPVLTLGWTLNYEMLFYAIFAIGLLFPRRFGLAVIFGAFAVLITSGFIFDNVQIDFWSDPIIIEFLFGIVLGMAYIRGLRLSITPALGLAAIGVSVAIMQLDLARWLASGVPALMVTAAVVLGPPMRNSAVPNLLGGASYALYLTHPFVLIVMAYATILVGSLPPLVFIFLSLIGSVLVSIAIHICIELPIGRRLASR